MSRFQGSILAFLSLALLWGQATPAEEIGSRQATIAFVQGRDLVTNVNSASITTPNFAAPASTGNLIVCTLVYGTPAIAVSSVTDSQGNTYAKAGNHVADGNVPGWRMEIWYAQNITGGSSFNVTATLASTINIYKRISCHEYSGVARSGALDQTATANGNSNTGSVGPVTTTAANELLYTALSVWNGPASPGTGFTARSSVDGDVVFDRITGAAGSYSASGGPTGGGYHMAMVTFKPHIDVAGSARWLAQSKFTISSLETGRIGYLEAWGGDEFGYSYHYSLRGQPAGLTVDAESGMLSVSSPIAAGTYNFVVEVRNRKVTSKLALFDVQLEVFTGVTSNRTGTQILHKTYNVDDAVSFGSPVGNDYTEVLMNIRDAVIADQNAAGDEKLRATIQFRRNTLYQYSNNRWPWGIQYLKVQPNPADSTGLPKPRLQGTGTTGWNSLQGAIIRTGQSWGHKYNATDEENDEAPKATAYEIETTTVGSNQVVLKNVADAANLKVGRYHMIMSYDQQMYGFPPNNRYFEYVKVTGVSGSTVSLDRKLRHIHRDDFWEANNDTHSLGRARIVALDRGGSTGVDPTLERLVLRSTWDNIEFVENPMTNDPVAPEEQGHIVEMEGVIDAELTNCIVPHLVASNLWHGRLDNVQVNTSEGDKQVGMFLVDNSTLTDLFVEYTSTDLLWLRNTQAHAFSVMPREFRSWNSTIDTTGDSVFTGPLYIRSPWATQKIAMVNTTFDRVGTPAQAIGSGWPVPEAEIGVDADWSSNQLQIPTTHPLFSTWLAAAWEGAIVVESGNSSSYGVITKVSAPAGNDYLYLDINWLGGTKPTSGSIYMEYIHELSVDATSDLQNDMGWGPTGAMKQTIPSAWDANGNYAFPALYPAATYGF